MTGTLSYQVSVNMFRRSGVWVKPPRLLSVRLILVGAGGGGHSSDPGGGGGGGAAVQSRWIAASELPDNVSITVGLSTSGSDGGDSIFLDYRAPGGKRGTRYAGGAGGLAPWRGGAGSAPNGGPGESMSRVPIGWLCGAGGGGGSGEWGGDSGPAYVKDGSQPAQYQKTLLWPGVLQAGNGGGGIAPGWPGGGGRQDRPGADGSVAILETTYIMED